MQGSPKQVAWAESIISDAIESIQQVAKQKPQLSAPCADLQAMLLEIQDAGWIISCRHTLGLKLRCGDLDMDSLHQHQLFRDERWRNPALRKGLGGISESRASDLKRQFLDAR